MHVSSSDSGAFHPLLGLAAMLIRRQGLADQIPDKTSELGVDFLKKALTIDYRKRPTVKDLLKVRAVF